MRVVVSIRPFYGHFHPVAPLARALGAAGHGVTVATEAGFCPVIERSGFTAWPAGLDPFAPAPWEGYEFSAAVTRRKVEDLLRLVATAPVDLILRDPTDFAAVIAAEALGVPHVTIGLARFTPEHWWCRVLGSSLDSVRHALGLSPDPRLNRLHSWLYIDTVPPWLQVADGLPLGILHRVRPEPYEAPAPSSHPVGNGTRPDKPVVLVTLGTVYNRRPALLEVLCRGAVRAGAQVICTLGPRQDAATRSLSELAGVQVEDYVPISAILPHCAAVVTHGGYNTVLAAVLHGRPLLVVPLGSDNHYNATRCEELGVGIRRTAESLTENQVADSISSLLARPRYHDAAARLAAETAQLPSAGTAVPLLERLAEQRPRLLVETGQVAPRLPQAIYDPAHLR